MSAFSVRVVRVDDVRKHPDADRLTIVTAAGYEVVANLQDDGTPRWKAGEIAVYVSENAIVPEDVLKERGYWEEGAKKGLLGGSKGNRVKMQRFAGFESRGLLFKIEAIAGMVDVKVKLKSLGSWSPEYSVGDDVTEFFGITEYVPQ